MVKLALECGLVKLGTIAVDGTKIVPVDLPPARKSKIASHEREKKNKNQIDSADESVLFFDAAKVPVEVIVAENPLRPDLHDLGGRL